MFIWRETTHLVVHGLCGWRRSEACWPCLWGWTPWPEEARSGARSSPKTPPAHRRNPDRHTNTQTLIKDPNMEKTDTSSFSGVQVLASAQESLKNKSTTAILVWKHSFVRSQVGKMTLNRHWTLTCSIGKDPTCLYAVTALFSTYVCTRQWFPHIHLTLAGCQGVLTATQVYYTTHFSICLTFLIRLREDISK